MARGDVLGVKGSARAAGTGLRAGRVTDHGTVSGLRPLFQLNRALGFDHERLKGLGRGWVVDAWWSQRRVAERGALLRRRAGGRAEDARDAPKRHVDLAGLAWRCCRIAVEVALARQVLWGA